VRSTFNPLRAIYRREIARGRISVNPTTGLELPAVGSGRDRIADPAEAAQLLAALSDEDRGIWATAMYAGLRRGELMALRANRVDLEAGIIHVEFGWDERAGEIPPKNRRTRRVPIASVLREHLLAQLLRTGRRDDELLFGRAPRTPFEVRRLGEQAAKAWKAAGLKRITLHECRHTYASLMIDAKVNAKALSTYMGHATIAITLDLYGHLMPGNEEEAAGLLDAYLARTIPS
jgi:integrase